MQLIQRFHTKTWLMTMQICLHVRYEGVWGSGTIAPLTPSLGTRWRSEDSHSLLLTQRHEFQRGPGCIAGRKNLSSSSEIEPRFIGRAACSPFTIPTEVSIEKTKHWAYLTLNLTETFSRVRHIWSKQNYGGKVQVVTADFSVDLGSGLRNRTT